jgi:hypothetical protein
MTDRADLIRMAREAGFRKPNPHDGCMGLVFGYRNGSDSGASLERFAALVAAAEREACAEHYLGIARKAIEEEREACYQIALTIGDYDAGCKHTDRVAQLIKDRSKQ